MEEKPRGTILALCQDVFFGMRIRTTLAKLGWDLQLCKSEAELVDAAQATPDAALALIDFNHDVDWSIVNSVLAGPIPTIGYSSHTNVDGFRAARAAGLDRVVSNGEFSRSLPELIEKYARQ